MKIPKKTFTVICMLALLLALMPAAFAEQSTVTADREYLNPETDGIAAIYDMAGLLTEEEKNQLLDRIQGCTDWFDFYIVTTDGSVDELTEDPALHNVWTGYHLALLFGGERKDMRVQWAFYPENELVSPDDVATMFSSAKSGYLDGDSAYEAADSFARQLLEAVQGSGAEQADLQHDDEHYYFRSLETLREVLELNPEGEIYISGLAAQDYTLDEDLTIPTGKKVFFNEGTVTVAPGVAVTVEENAGLFFYGLDVKGTIINNGNLVQCEKREGTSIQLPIRVEGEIINRDWFSFYEIAEGMENIQNEDAGRLFSSVKGRRVSTDEPAPTPNSTPKSSPMPSGSTDSTEKNSSDDLPTATVIFWGILIVAAILSKKQGIWKKRTNLPDARNQDNGKPAVSAQSRQSRKGGSAAGRTRAGAATVGNRTERTPGRRSSVYNPEVYNPAEYSYDPADYSETDYMAHDNQRRMKQLDDWLKSGLIDKEEYRTLKNLYTKK